MSVGKSAAEVRTSKGRDEAAINEIDNLWREVIAEASAAAKRKKQEVAANG
jgi:hypothetical protein